MKPEIGIITLSVIIVNWNTRELLRNCLASVLANWSHIQLEIVVIDNASTDGSAELVETEFPSVRLLRNKKNVGFVKANNQGAEIANGRYLLLLNSDTLILDKGVDGILSYMDAHPEVGIVTGKVLNKDGSFQRPFRRFPHPIGAFFRHTTRLIVGFNTPFHKRHFMAGVDEECEQNVDWVSGAYLFVRREFVNDGKIFDEDIFMYYEDALLCYRVRERGARVIYIPIAPIIHYKGASAKHIQALSNFNSFFSSTVYFKKTRGSSVSLPYSGAVRLTWMLFAGFFSLLKIIPYHRFADKAKLFCDLTKLAYNANADDE